LTIYTATDLIGFESWTSGRRTGSEQWLHPRTLAPDLSVFYEHSTDAPAVIVLSTIRSISKGSLCLWLRGQLLSLHDSTAWYTFRIITASRPAPLRSGYSC